MPTKLYALDTSFIINFLRGNERAREVYEEIKGGKLVVPAPVLMESLRGADDIGEFQRLETLEFGKAEAGEATDLISYLEEKGEMIGILDIMIAATASTTDAKIVTYDQDFQKLDEKLDIITADQE